MLQGCRLPAECLASLAQAARHTPSGLHGRQSASGLCFLHHLHGCKPHVAFAAAAALLLVELLQGTLLVQRLPLLVAGVAQHVTDIAEAQSVDAVCCVLSVVWTVDGTWQTLAPAAAEAALDIAVEFGGMFLGGPSAQQNLKLSTEHA